MIVIILAVSYFVGRLSDLVVSAAITYLLRVARGTSGVDIGVFYSILGAILALVISLSSILTTTGTGMADSAT